MVEDVWWKLYGKGEILNLRGKCKIGKMKVGFEKVGNSEALYLLEEQGRPSVAWKTSIWADSDRLRRLSEWQRCWILCAMYPATVGVYLVVIGYCEAIHDGMCKFDIILTGR
jgi:hypothetical protein